MAENYMDPFASTMPQVGDTTAIGNTMLNPNDPLIDWASNLKKDDLAHFLQDPQGAAARFAAQGIAPPDPAAMSQMHDVNTNTFKTPTGPQPDRPSATRGWLDPAGPPVRSSPQAYARQGVLDQKTINDAYTAVGGSPAGLPPSASAFAAQPQDRPEQSPTYSQLATRPPPVSTAPNSVPDPGYRPEETGPSPLVEGIKRRFRESQEAKPYAPGEQPGTPPILRPNPPAATAAPPPAGPAAAQPITAQSPRKTQDLPGEALNKPEPDYSPAEAGPNAKPTEEEKSYNPNTPEGRKNLAEKAGALGKAMQGVKAPEGLKPPNIGAPSVRQHSTMQAPQLAQLLGLASGVQSGQVPASAMPVLRMLGRV